MIGSLAVEQLGTGWSVLSGALPIAAFTSNADAWAYVDAHTDEGRADTDRYNRIRIAFSEHATSR
jgi:hypothetical protein